MADGSEYFVGSIFEGLGRGSCECAVHDWIMSADSPKKKSPDDQQSNHRGHLLWESGCLGRRCGEGARDRKVSKKSMKSGRCKKGV